MLELPRLEGWWETCQHEVSLCKEKTHFILLCVWVGEAVTMNTNKFTLCSNPSTRMTY